jgi:hypothetical protein
VTVRCLIFGRHRPWLLSATSPIIEPRNQLVVVRSRLGFRLTVSMALFQQQQQQQQQQHHQLLVASYYCYYYFSY